MSLTPPSTPSPPLSQVTAHPFPGLSSTPFYGSQSTPASKSKTFISPAWKEAIALVNSAGRNLVKEKIRRARPVRFQLDEEELASLSDLSDDEIYSGNEDEAPASQSEEEELVSETHLFDVGGGNNEDEEELEGEENGNVEREEDIPNEDVERKKDATNEEEEENTTQDVENNTTNKNAEREKELSPATNTNKKGKRKNTPRQSRSQRSNLIIPVSRVDAQLRKGNPGMRAGKTAPVFFAAVIEYLAAEILELSSDLCLQVGKKVIKPRHVCLAVKQDAELSELLKDVMIYEGGVQETLPRKRPQTEGKGKDTNKGQKKARK